MTTYHDHTISLPKRFIETAGIGAEYSGVCCGNIHDLWINGACRQSSQVNHVSQDSKQEMTGATLCSNNEFVLYAQLQLRHVDLLRNSCAFIWLRQVSVVSQKGCSSSAIPSCVNLARHWEAHLFLLSRGQQMPQGHLSLPRRSTEGVSGCWRSSRRRPVQSQAAEGQGLVPQRTGCRRTMSCHTGMWHCTQLPSRFVQD